MGRPVVRFVIMGTMGYDIVDREIALSSECTSIAAGVVGALS